MKVGTGSEYFVHVIIIVLLVIIIAMLLMQGQKKESFDMEHFYACQNDKQCSAPKKCKDYNKQGNGTCK